MTKKIEDFGEKIGGAKKDLWMSRGGLTEIDLRDMTEAEKTKYVTKDNIWPRPNYDELYKTTGTSLEKLMYLKTVYDSLPKTSVYHTEFIDYINDVRKNLEEFIKLPDETFAHNLNKKINFHLFCQQVKIGNDAYGWFRYDRDADLIRKGIFTNKTGKAMQSDFETMYKKVTDSDFLINKEQKFLRTHQIVYIDGKDNKVEKDYDGELRLRFAEKGNGMYLALGFKKPADIEKIEVGDYVISGLSYNDEVHPCKTKEEAEEVLNKLAKEFANIFKGKKEVAVSKPRKKMWKSDIVHEGDYRIGPKILTEGQKIKGEDYLNDFKFKGGEFGNWLNQEDRQNTLNNGYEAFVDLAHALGITADSVSLGEKLNIAFGSRGHGNAAAHYEPLRNVINLTKINGAGCLAHEWGHALDEYICRNGLSDIRNDIIRTMQYKVETVTKEIGIKEAVAEAMNDKGALGWLKYSDGYKAMNDEQKVQAEKILENILTASANKDMSSKIMNEVTGIFGKVQPEDSVVAELDKYMRETTHKHLPTLIRDNIVKWCNKVNMSCKIDSLRGDTFERTVKTDYLEISEAFDKQYSKCDKGYWASGEEMFARAFDCYITDKLGYKSDYLCGITYTGQPAPDGEEKAKIYEKFDELISMCKVNGLLKEGQITYDEKENVEEAFMQDLESRVATNWASGNVEAMEDAITDVANYGQMELEI